MPDSFFFFFLGGGGGGFSGLQQCFGFRELEGANGSGDLRM